MFQWFAAFASGPKTPTQLSEEIVGGFTCGENHGLSLWRRKVLRQPGAVPDYWGETTVSTPTRRSTLPTLEDAEPLRSLPDSCKGSQVDDTCCLLGNNSHDSQVEAFSEKRLTTRVSKYRLSPFSCMGLCKQQLKKRAQAAREGAFFGQARPDAGPSCTLDAPCSPHLFLKVEKSIFLLQIRLPFKR